MTLPQRLLPLSGCCQVPGPAATRKYFSLPPLPHGGRRCSGRTTRRVSRCCAWWLDTMWVRCGGSLWGLMGGWLGRPVPAEGRVCKGCVRMALVGPSSSRCCNTAVAVCQVPCRKVIQRQALPCVRMRG